MFYKASFIRRSEEETVISEDDSARSFPRNHCPRVRRSARLYGAGRDKKLPAGWPAETMTNVTSEIIAGIDKPGNRGKGGLAGSHEVASHQGRIKEGLAGRPVGKGWERTATEEEGQHRSNRLRIVWELTSRNFQAAYWLIRVQGSEALAEIPRQRPFNWRTVMNSLI